MDPRIKVGSVVQCNEKMTDACWIGVLLLVTELKSWGIQGFAAMPGERDKPAGQAYMRVKFDCLEWIGDAVLVPPPDCEDQP